MKRCGFEFDRDIFNILISVYGRCGFRIDVFKMFEEMTKAGFSFCVIIYNVFLNVLVRKGDWRVAELVI